MSNVFKQIEAEINELYADLDRLHAGEPVSCNGVAWDGDSRNQYGYGCVETKIYAEIEFLQDLLEV